MYIKLPGTLRLNAIPGHNTGFFTEQNVSNSD